MSSADFSTCDFCDAHKSDSSGQFRVLPPVTLFFVVAALGVPGLGNFVGDFLILLGSFQVATLVTCIAATGLVLGAVYSLILIQRAFHGAAAADAPQLKDLSKREMSMMAVLMAVMLWIGLYPQPLLDTSAASMRGVQAIYSAAQARDATAARMPSEAQP